jgi:cephalosporin hydroxylase
MITVDIADYAQEAKKLRLWQDRVEFILGDSVSKETIDRIKELIKGSKKVIVTLDSDHHAIHVLRELRLYSKFVTVGSYLIVQDTSLDIWGKKKEFWNNGPMTAMQRFLEFNDDFVIDKKWNKFLLTWHPDGFLKRIK